MLDGWEGWEGWKGWLGRSGRLVNLGGWDGGRLLQAKSLKRKPLSQSLNQFQIKIPQPLSRPRLQQHVLRAVHQAQFWLRTALFVADV